MVALTDYIARHLTASPRDDDSLDHGAARLVGRGFDSGHSSDGEMMSGSGEMDDELLVDAMTEDLIDDDEHAESEEQLPAFDPAAMGLKEINNLAHFGVSSHKPGNGVAELLSEDLDKYWQYA